MDHLVHQVKLEGLVRFRQQLFRHKLIISDPPPPPNNNNNSNNETKKGVTQHDKGDGLWDASCGGLDHDTERLQMGLRNYLSGWNQQLLDWNNNHTTTAMTSSSTSSTTRTTVFPVNTWDEGGGFGMVSYPNFLGDCRFLAYPNLDLWYDGVCGGGGENIDCEYVYLYRDPAAILQSTTINRDFNPTVLSGIHLYIAMYHIIASQLLQELLTAEEEEEEDSNSSSRRSRSKTLGCYGFYEPNDTSSWWDGVRMLGGWGEPKTGGGSHKNDTNTAPLVLKNHNNKPFPDYDTFMTKMYKAPKPVNDSFIPAEYEMYMKPLKRIHDRVIQICKKNLAAREGKI